LLAFARRQRLKAVTFTGIGAFSAVTLGFFEREQKEYKKIPLAEQVEF
jgi:predicted DNA-binding protein with PD1-like motif